MNRRIILLAAFASLIGAGWPAVAQITATGHITGRVTDVTGSALPGVTVTVSGPGFREEAFSDADGWFDVEGLLEGAPTTYTVTAELAGFETATLDKLTVDPAGGIRVAMMMHVGCLDEAHRLSPELAEAFRQAHAVVLLRVMSFTNIPRLKLSDDCGRATEFVANVTESIKGDVPGPLTNIRFFLMDDYPSSGAVGDHIAFLEWDQGVRAYRIPGRATLVPVRGGWVESDYLTSAGIPPGPVTDVVIALRSLGAVP